MISVIEYNKKYKSDVLALIKKVLFEIFGSKPKKLEIEKGFTQKGSKLLLAKDNDKIIGISGILRQNDSVGRIKKMYILKDYRNKGLGQKLFDKIRKFAKKNKYKRLILSTTPEMQSAIHFYQKNGFKEYKTIKSKNQIFFEKIL